MRFLFACLFALNAAVVLAERWQWDFESPSSTGSLQGNAVVSPIGPSGVDYVGMPDSKMERTEVLPVLHMGIAQQISDVDIDDEKVYRNDLTGKVLDPKLVREARQKKLDFFDAKGGWVKSGTDEARRRRGKPPIPVRWVDVNKEDDLTPNTMSRLVAREIRQPGEEAIFAPTLPSQ